HTTPISSSATTAADLERNDGNQLSSSPCQRIFRTPPCSFPCCSEHGRHHAACLEAVHTHTTQTPQRSALSPDTWATHTTHTHVNMQHTPHATHTSIYHTHH